MATYTVQKGDTLSGIGSKLGVDWRSITGYRSGNPNLIFAGENLNYGSPAPAPSAAPAPTPAPAPDPSAGIIGSLTGELTNFDQNRKGAADIYNAALESLGISDARTRVSNLRQSLVNTENLYNNVESDISGRTQDSLVSESQRRRLVAKEQAPLAGALGTMGRNLDTANADYQGILGEGKTQADLQFQTDSTKRAAIMDRLQIAINNSKDAESKRQWQAEFDRLKAQDAEATRQFNANLALSQQKASLGSASGGGSGGRSSSGGVTQKQAADEFLGYIAGQFSKAGGAGSYKASRQEQDNWANAWFASKGITSPSARQYYWDLFNSNYNRSENPTKDWLYKK